MSDLIHDGGFYFWLLLIASIVAVTFILERGWALRRALVLPAEVREAIDQARGSEVGVAALRAVCQSRPSALSRLIGTAIEHLRWSKDENAVALEVQARQEVVRLERGLVILEIIVGIAPLLGLVGTIHGIIPLFGEFGSIGSDNSVLARGIAAALNKTLMGLMVAIPSLVAWSYFNKKVEVLAVELEAECDLFLRHYYLVEPASAQAVAQQPVAFGPTTTAGTRLTGA